ncbi:hypothetical protein EDB84DRAFT_1439410 [Lactarius hengduanensis]|nr:hypothetical protein EDB84DRAFT_1439410 [Lactarius hengduanensis]
MTRTAASAVPVHVPHTAVANPALSPFIPVVPAAVPSAAASRRGSGRGRAVIARPSAYSSRGRLAPLLRRGRVVVAPSSCRCRAVVTPSSRHRWSSCESLSCGLHHAACVVAWGSPRSGGGGLRSESMCGSGVGGGHRYYPIALPLHADPLYSRDNTVAGTQSTTPPHPVPWPPHPSPLLGFGIILRYSPSPPPPPPCSIQARGRRLQPIATPPPPPPLTARKSRHNATPTRRATPTATTPTTTVTWQREQHGGRNAGEPTIMAMTPLAVPTTWWSTRVQKTMAVWACTGSSGSSSSAAVVTGGGV